MTTYTPSSTFDKYMQSSAPKEPIANQKIYQPRDNLRKVKHLMTIGDSDASVFSCKFDANDKYLAAGYGDGITRIYNVDTQRLAFTLYGQGGNEEMPVADLAWRPTNDQMKTANILVTAQADGTLKHWHATTGKCLHQIQPDPENQFYTLDFKPDGTLLAVAGKDK